MIHYVECLPPATTPTKGTILLIHGFPQTWYQFRRVITPLSDAGFRIIAPDYRGAGGSTKPWDGYDKNSMARDMHVLLTDVLGITEPVHVVGHDIGGMIAHTYAARYPDHCASVCWGECPLVGSKLYYDRRASMGGWHYTFHNVLDLPELLVAGRERIYLKHFYDRLGQNPDAISDEDLGVYAQAYAQPGALRAGFNCYRAFEADAENNNSWLQEKGKCRVRCLTLWGGASYFTEEEVMASVELYYENVKFEAIKGAGHWIAEEKPKVFVETVLKWVQQV